MSWVELSAAVRNIVRFLERANETDGDGEKLSVSSPACDGGTPHAARIEATGAGGLRAETLPVAAANGMSADRNE